MLKKIDSLNLLITINRDYVQPLSVLLSSYEQTHEGVRTNVYIMHATLTDEDFYFLRRGICSPDIQLHSIRVDERRFDKMPVLERLGAESFYRLLAFAYLPKEVKKCLYLDADILIRKSLLSLYSIRLTDAYVAAASHIRKFNNTFNCWRIGLKKENRYINSGVLLMNLENIRKDFTVEGIFEALNKNARRLFMGDQDLCNILFSGKIRYVDERIYNLDERVYRQNKKTFPLQKVKEQTAIVHYNGKNKPWLNGYKGVLDCFYPEVEKTGRVTRCNAFRRLKAILRIVFVKKQ